jgi:adenine-specific DNA-methyltransferase
MPTLNWIGKQAVVNHHQEVPFHLLKDVPELSCGDPGSGNLIVQGDNLVALKALLPYYAKQVKCIYIDPPYNTGNEGWIYNDNVSSPMIRRWLTKVVGREGEDLSRHDKWLCMMYPRLVVLREFLHERGSIFVNIDDTEVAHLRLMLDEIFGQRNFIANIVWQKKYSGSNDHKTIAPMHDHLLVYSKGEQFHRNLLPRTEEKDRQYRFSDKGGVFRISDYTCNKTADERPNLYYAIKNPHTGQEIWPKRTRVWAYSVEVYQAHIRDDLIWWGKEGKAKVPAFKRYRDSLRGGGGTVPATWWAHDFAGHTDASKKELRDILGHGSQLDFFTPKPTLLIQRVLQVVTGPNDLVLDSFAGSGTTGHAVLELNKRDGGNRRFILVEMESTIAREITVERVKRVAEGFTNARGQPVEKLGGGFRFCELGEPLFDENGTIRKLVRFCDLARHVYFTETGEPLPRERVKNSPLLGVTSNGVAIYLLYNGILADRSVNGGNILTGKTQALLPEHSGPKVVYAAGSRLSNARLKRENITFKQTPYAIKVK